MKLANLFSSVALAALSSTGWATFAESGIVIHCSDTKGAKLTVNAPSAFEFAKSYGSANYWGPAHGANGNTQIIMGCDVDNSDSSHGVDLQFKAPNIKCGNSLIRDYTPKATLYRSGNLLVATIEEVASWRPEQPFPVTEMTCDK